VKDDAGQDDLGAVVGGVDCEVQFGRQSSAGASEAFPVDGEVP
jgi:hypothetical protein